MNREWEERIWEAARAELPASALETRVLAEAIHERTRRYTSDRERLHERPRDPARDLAARAVFFTVADAAKIAFPLRELGGLVPARVRLLDVGAGCGAMSVGLAAAGVELDEVTAVDRDAAALAILRRVLPSARTIVADVASAAPGGPYDLIAAGTVLNELGEADRLPLVRRLLGSLSADGSLILIEPALRETARPLHRLRDALIAEGVTVYAPCTRRIAPCPALAADDDWCHEDRPWTPPPRLAQLVRATGLRAHGLKFAYLTLRRRPDHLAGRLRVVSGALDSKGVVERIVCGDDGRAHLRVLKRDPESRALARTKRGDVL
jgi:2-polyprenyl-3-methyl-5-hydroxy-6-metoxy-1,4-benzoquinol methylase